MARDEFGAWKAQKKAAQRRKPKPVSPIARQAQRDLGHEKRQKREAEVVRLVDQSIAGTRPAADIASELLRLKPNEREQAIAKGRGVAAQRKRDAALRELPKAGLTAFDAVSTGLLGAPLRPTLENYRQGGIFGGEASGELQADIPFFWSRPGKTIEAALNVPKGSSRAEIDEAITATEKSVERLSRQLERLEKRVPRHRGRDAQIVRARRAADLRLGQAESKLHALRSLRANTVPDEGKKVVGSLGEAKRLQREQEALRRTQRAERAGRAEKAAEEVGGEAGFRAARAELRGEYATLPFTRLIKEFGEADSSMRRLLQPRIDETLDFIQSHPKLGNKQFAKDNTKSAFLKVIDGKLPTKSERRLLEDVFGEEVAQHFKWRHAYEIAINAVNVPKALRASYDLSAPFRQGIVLGARHPVLFARAWGPMFRAARSEKGYQKILDEIHARPTFETMQEAGVKFTELGRVSVREEAFMSNIAEAIPVVGKGVRISGRAYTAFLDKLRADAFDLYLAHAEHSTSGFFHRGAGLESLGAAERAKVLKSAASWVNVGTGRGGLGLESLEKAAPLLTAGLFSPRLIASRVSLLNPIYYAKLHPFARKQAVEGMLRLMAAGSLTLWLAKQAGAEVGLDPRSADFGKIKIGNTRIDIWGGLQPYVVNSYRVAKKESVSSTTGEMKTLEGGFGEQSRWDIFEDFLVGKASPPAGYVIGSAKGKKPSGEEFGEAKEFGRLFLPLGFENAYEGYTQRGPAGPALHLPEFFGFGVQTYGASARSGGTDFDSWRKKKTSGSDFDSWKKSRP